MCSCLKEIPDAISIDSLKRNSPNFTSLGNFFLEHFGERRSDEYADAKACFVESLAAYSIVCFLLQIKDRHNGNILLDNRGHLVHIDFGFYFLSSPGKNSGFESAPFKLTRDFVDLMDGPNNNVSVLSRIVLPHLFVSAKELPSNYAFGGNANGWQRRFAVLPWSTSRCCEGFARPI